MVCAVQQAHHREVQQALVCQVAELVLQVAVLALQEVVLALQAVSRVVVGKKISSPVIDFRLSLLYKGKKVINRGIAYASLYAPNILKAESVRL